MHQWTEAAKPGAVVCSFARNDGRFTFSSGHGDGEDPGLPVAAGSADHDVQSNIVFPDAERMAPGKSAPIMLNGVKITTEILFRLRRTTPRTNEVRVGGGMVRYAKNRPLSEDVAKWQSAFLLGFLALTGVDPSEFPEAKLCLTVDAFVGKSYAAPGDSVSRFKNMKSACEAIAERWEKIQPPPRAILED